MRVRSIGPGEQAKSLWDEINVPNGKFYYADLANGKVVESIDEKAVFLCYSEADAAEDMVLFPDELTSIDRSVPSKEISNPVTEMETASATILQYWAEHTKIISNGEDPASGHKTSTTTIWSLPRI